ncbi:M10 family metallopeptidase [Limimaricola hongkongensis]|uniref:M10 family metallopeptidase n=1 Tax=Limimaricola hongkongensis TaxID=278132 RepID=UPI000B02F692|nr:M10 family metallopeptidase [Limimaricola hongkongensis]
MPRHATPHEIADYLTGGYNESTRIPYTFFDPKAAGPITVDLGGLDAEGRQLARWAMDAWECVADVHFAEVSGGAALSFQDNGSGAYAKTYANADGTITKATINVDDGWIAKHGAGVDSYTFRTYMHEIGHVLGLGHAGPYNGHADYGDAIFKNDSWQLSVMSYLGQDENPNIDASRGGNVTPMQADLIAIRDIWGAPETHFADGDTVWGIGSKLEIYLGDMFRGMADHTTSDAYDLQPITLYIEDHGGRDRINFSHAGMDQIVDLAPGAVSSVLGDQRNNMLLSEDTLIEEFVSGDGNDRITGNGAANSLWGGGRDDLLKGLGGNDRLWGDAGQDRIIGGGGRDQLRGGDHDDLLRGQGGNDRLWGDAGRDRVMGGAGRDQLHGGDHDDLLRGQGGHDRLWGDAGQDRIMGGAGRDKLRGGDHVDLLDGQGGNDRIWGDAGGDTLVGGGGRDSLWGGDNQDTLRGDGGHDHLDGGEAGDLLIGGAGNDTLIGGHGLDTLYGGAGNDRLDGGDAPDALFGGAGADSFVLRRGYGTETIGDFVIGEDLIELQAGLMPGLTAESAAARGRDTDEGDLMFNFDDGNRLRLTGLAGNELSADSFVIV